MTRLGLRSLRARLLAAFVLVTVIGVAAAAFASAQAAANSLVAASQQRIVVEVQQRISSIAPTLDYPPALDTLDRLREAVGPDTLVTYRSLRSSSLPRDGEIPASFRHAVHHGQQLFSQRITDGDGPLLLVGTPLMLTAPDGSRSPSGIEVNTFRSLADVQAQVDDVTRAALTASALAVPVSLIFAWIAAGSVLRPVRDLRDTARRLSAGDLTARTRPRGRDELAELTTTVNEMAGTLENSLTTMRQMSDDAKQFVADVSHELRTPLSTLTAVVELLYDATHDLPGYARESSQLALTETLRLVHLVEELMEVSRFDAGTARVVLERCDLREIVSDTVRLRGWADTVDLLAPETVEVRVDRRRIDMIVANLIENGLRHGSPPVTAQITDGDGVATITVSDNGAGIPDAALPHVFDRFYKADPARPRSTGSGLGLAIAQGHARLHGGTITAQNIRGGGARFTLTLPKEHQHEADPNTSR